METEITIKEEPIDYIDVIKDEVSEPMLHSDIKVEYDDPLEDFALAADEPFKIVEEANSVITIKAVDLKSEDEANFLNRMNLAFFSGSSFQEESMIEMTIKEEPQECDEIHMKPLTCSFCNKIYDTTYMLLQHMCNEHRNLKEFICSSCRKSFPTFTELSRHWKANDSTCDVSMENQSTSLKPSTFSAPKGSTPQIHMSTLNTRNLDNIIKSEFCTDNNIEYITSECVDQIKEESILPDYHFESSIVQRTPGPSTNSQLTSFSLPTKSNENNAIQKSITSKVQVFNIVSKISDIVTNSDSEHRKTVLSKPILNVIENLPEKKKLIRILQEQMKKAESSNPDNIKMVTKNTRGHPIEATADENKVEKINVSSEKVPSLLLSLQHRFEPQLVRARKNYPEYSFHWLCPKCDRLFEHRYTFRIHLINMHEMSTEELQTMLFHVQPTKTSKKNCRKTGKASSTCLVSTSPDLSNSSSNQSESEAKQNKQQNNAQNKYKYTCPKCDRVCSSRTMLNDHIGANCSRQPQYSCKECSKKFFSASTLNCHMTIHTGELPFKCNYCDKKFRTRGQVTVHHRTHTGERPFACPICHQSFNHRETLISHLSRHIGMKRYKCYGCEKQFSSISGLKMHREIRPDSCGKVKLNSRALGPRVRVVQGNVIFEPQPEVNPYLRTEDPEVAILRNIS